MITRIELDLILPTSLKPLDQNEVKAKSRLRPGCQIRVPGHSASWPPMFKRSERLI